MEEAKPHTIGIVCDNYKLKKYEKELDKKGFTDRKLINMNPGSPLAKTTLIKILTPKENQNKIAAICQLVEAHFKQSN